MAPTSNAGRVALPAANVPLVSRDVITRKTGEVISVKTPDFPEGASTKVFNYLGNQWTRGRGQGSRQITAVRPKASQPLQWGLLVTVKNVCFYHHAGVDCRFAGKCNNFHAPLGAIMSDLPRRTPVQIGKLPRRLRAQFNKDLRLHAADQEKIDQMRKEFLDQEDADAESEDASDDDPRAELEKFAEEYRAAKRAKLGHPAEPSHSAEPPPLPSAPASVPVESAATPPASSIPMSATPAPAVEVAPPAPASTGTAGEGTPEEEEIVTA